MDIMVRLAKMLSLVCTAGPMGVLKAMENAFLVKLAIMEKTAIKQLFVIKE